MNTVLVQREVKSPDLLKIKTAIMQKEDYKEVGYKGFKQSQQYAADKGARLLKVTEVLSTRAVNTNFFASFMGEWFWAVDEKEQPVSMHIKPDGLQFGGHSYLILQGVLAPSVPAPMVVYTTDGCEGITQKVRESPESTVQIPNEAITNLARLADCAEARLDYVKERVNSGNLDDIRALITAARKLGKTE